MVVFALSFEFARKEHATGYLTPVGGWSRVTVRYPAVVRRRFVETGDVVAAGDVLFELRASEGIEEGVSVVGRLLDDIGRRRRVLLERKDATEARYASDAALLEAERGNAEREADYLATELMGINDLVCKVPVCNNAGRTSPGRAGGAGREPAGQRAFGRRVPSPWMLPRRPPQPSMRPRRSQPNLRHRLRRPRTW